jgi:dipeptidase D
MKKNISKNNQSLVSGKRPKELWENFLVLCNTPRQSKNEAMVAKFIIELAAKHQRMVSHDELSNVVVYIPATPGYENHPSICLQSHIDMVWDEKWAFPIELMLNENKMLSANGTTLGADNGIGAAAMMALIADDQDFNHGPLELFFTTQEEIGLIGAERFNYDLLTSKWVLNLDTEEEGVVCVGCAGGARSEGTMEIDMLNDDIKNIGNKYHFKVSGFMGGHSGVDIHLGRANAIKVLAEILSDIQKDIPFNLISFSGGSAMNAIPSEAEAVVIIPDYEEEKFFRLAALIEAKFPGKYPDEKAQLSINEVDFTGNEEIFSTFHQERFLELLNDLPDGVISMEPKDPKTTQTSNNIGLVRMDGNKVVITSMYRSSLQSGIDSMEKIIRELFDLASATIKVGSRYSPWEPQFDTALLRKFCLEYGRSNLQMPSVETIHAGLEGAVLYNHIPGVQIISFGPTMGDVHTPREWVDMDSVTRFWDLLLNVITAE